MKTVLIRHITDSDPIQFEVLRLHDGKSSESIEAPSPIGFPDDLAMPRRYSAITGRVPLRV